MGFAVRGGAISLASFALFRVPFIESGMLLPLTRGQETLALLIGGVPAAPVAITIACSGSDAMAVCLGATLAFPASWRQRGMGALGGAMLMAILNTLRIATLFRVSGHQPWFDVLHLYAWPAVITLALGIYVFSWMHRVERVRAPRSRTGRLSIWRFAVVAGTCVVLFAAVWPWLLESPAVWTLAGFVATTAAWLLTALGATAVASANVLQTARGGFAVTQECIATPLIPLYVAGVVTCSTTWRRLIAGAVGAVPLFFVLAVLRLMLVALPSIAAPLFFVHAFYQLLLAFVVVFLAARWRHSGWSTFYYGLGGIALGLAIAVIVARALTGSATLLAVMPAVDPQGAVAFLPVFQAGLYAALWVGACLPLGWRRAAAGAVLLVAAQAVTVMSLQTWELMLPVVSIRAWALSLPMMIVAAMHTVGRTDR